MNLKEGWEEMEWMNMAQGRDSWQAVGITVMNQKMRGIS